MYVLARISVNYVFGVFMCSEVCFISLSHYFFSEHISEHIDDLCVRIWTEFKYKVNKLLTTSYQTQK